MEQGDNGQGGDQDDNSRLDVFGLAGGQIGSILGLNDQSNTDVGGLNTVRAYRKESHKLRGPVLQSGKGYCKEIRVKAEEDAIAILRGVKEPVVYQTASDVENAEFGEAQSNFDDVSTVRPMTVCADVDTPLNYKPDTTAPVLPVAKKKVQLLTNVRNHRVTIIQGNTGCGKTTQVPIFIAEDMSSRRQPYKIIVTQPRRIAAVSVSKHVARLLNSNLGDHVGYQVGLDKAHVSASTKIVYVTTGVLLQKIIHTKSLSHYTHIILDEVHERDVDTDILLMVIRKLMWEQNPKIKLILMSATFEAERLKAYFTINLNDPTYIGDTMPGHIEVGESPAPLSYFHLDQFLHLANTLTCPVPNKNIFCNQDATLHDELYQVAFYILDKLEAEGLNLGAVLVFLPGILEIGNMRQIIEEGDKAKKFTIFVLHSSVNDTDQHKVFGSVPQGTRKVILATNIAESSITVPDISYVIDFCLTKQLVVDQTSCLPALKLCWATKANCTQRAGRAGRVSAGRVYRMIYKDFFDLLPDYPTPEITRCPLELAVLKTKILGIGTPKELLGYCLDPPAIEGIRNAVIKLKRIGALSVNMADKSYEPENGQLTTIGKIMSNLPIEVTYSKLICLGYAFGIIDDCIDIASCLAANNIFFGERGKYLDGYKTRRSWSNQSNCDLIALRNLFKDFVSFSQEPQTSHKDLDRWARSNMVNLRRIHEATYIRDEIRGRLEAVGVSLESAPNIKIEASDADLILQCIIAGAFYPNYFSRRRADPSVMRRNFTNSNPYRSVQFQKLPEKTSVLYAKQLCNMFTDVRSSIELRISGQHATVTFPPSDNSFSSHVYAHPALKKSRLFLPDDQVERERSKNVFSEHVYNTLASRRDKAYIIKAIDEKFQGSTTQSGPQLVRDNVNKIEQIFKKHSASVSGANIRNYEYCLTNGKQWKIPVHQAPPLSRPKFDAFITFVESLGNFWAANMPKYDLRFKMICDALEKYEAKRLSKHDALYHYMPCIYVDDIQNMKFRAIIQSIYEDGPDPRVYIRLADNGQLVWTNLSQLMYFDYNRISNDQSLQILVSEMLVIQCQLIKIKPISVVNSLAKTPEESKKYFEQILASQISPEKIPINIYSYDDNVLRVSLELPICEHTSDKLCDSCVANEPQDISQHLVMKGYAEMTTEPYSSICDAKLRKEFCQSLDKRSTAAHSTNFLRIGDDVDDSLFIPSNHPLVRQTITLAGPNHPLHMNFHGLAKSYANFPVFVDSLSVNSIALEPDTTFNKERLMVAVTCHYSEGRINCTKTSLMPYIRGFPTLMSLIFAPVVELRKDDKNGFYESAICGIGGLPVKQSNNRIVNFSHDEPHDIEIPFDVLLTMSDLSTIQSIRHILSYIFNDNSPGQITTSFQLSGPSLNEYQDKLRLCLFSLLNKTRAPYPRSYSGPTTDRPNEYRWMLRDESIMEKQMQQLEKPFLSQIPLIRRFQPNLGIVQEKLGDFHEMLSTKDAAIPRMCECPLCGIRFFNKVDAILHVNNDEHKNLCDVFNVHLEEERKLLLQQQTDENSSPEPMDSN